MHMCTTHIPVISCALTSHCSSTPSVAAALMSMSSTSIPVIGPRSHNVRRPAIIACVDAGTACFKFQKKKTARDVRLTKLSAYHREEKSNRTASGIERENDARMNTGNPGQGEPRLQKRIGETLRSASFFFHLLSFSVSASFYLLIVRVYQIRCNLNKRI